MQMRLYFEGLVRGFARSLGAVGAPLALALLLAGCGAEINEARHEVRPASAGSAPVGATASLGMQPSTEAAAPRRSAKLLREVRALEGKSTGPVGEGYRIGSQDVLEISVFQAPDLTKTVQVAESGTINLPLVGDVRAGGVTARELEQELKARYGKRYLHNPQVSVFVREYNSQRVTVEGAVERPGVYPYRGQITLVQLMATAGGMKDVADGSEVMVFRTASGKREAARFDVDEIKAGRAADPAIMQGDVVIVGTSTAKKFYNDILKTLPVIGLFTVFI
jgi:polysaccharide export outer membrane protein